MEVLILFYYNLRFRCKIFNVNTAKFYYWSLPVKVYQDRQWNILFQLPPCFRLGDKLESLFHPTWFRFWYKGGKRRYQWVERCILDAEWPDLACILQIEQSPSEYTYLHKICTFWFHEYQIIIFITHLQYQIIILITHLQGMTLKINVKHVGFFLNQMSEMNNIYSNYCWYNLILMSLILKSRLT